MEMRTAVATNPNEMAFTELSKCRHLTSPLTASAAVAALSGAIAGPRAAPSPSHNISLSSNLASPFLSLPAQNNLPVRITPRSSFASLLPPDGVIASSVREQPLEDLGSQVRALALDIGGRVVGGGGSGGVGFSSSLEDEQDIGKSLNRAVNAAIVLDAGTFAITKLLTIDSYYWHVG
ncbi:hypothetical protein ZIOFF_062350 [Zingiber officinale]|uniref:Uncharacterized protein n=1 Tax=Zingiber officinale TaxID=94328 RepID=A0A8J5KJ57_ZINOF|nr:hypothetical protein ZIOFF_062350 [Zingiber officinale]